MAIAATNLTLGKNATGSPGNTTASVTPSANALVLLTIGTLTTFAPDITTPTVTGNSLTWVMVRHNLFASSPTFLSHLWVFRALGASPSAGTVTITNTDWVSETCWIIDQVTGVDTSGTNGSGAIVQDVASNPGSGATSGTATLAAFGSANNASYASWAVQAGNPITWTVGSGFTKIAEHTTSGQYIDTMTEYKLGDFDGTASWASAEVYQTGGIGIEVKAAAGAATLILPQTRPTRYLV